MLHLLAGLAKLAASRKSDVTTKPESKKKYRSGSKAPASGIYGCVDCGPKKNSEPRASPAAVSQRMGGRGADNVKYRTSGQGDETQLFEVLALWGPSYLFSLST